MLVHSSATNVIVAGFHEVFVLQKSRVKWIRPSVLEITVYGLYSCGAFEGMFKRITAQKKEWLQKILLVTCTLNTNLFPIMYIWTVARQQWVCSTPIWRVLAETFFFPPVALLSHLLANQQRVHPSPGFTRMSQVKITFCLAGLLKQISSS